MIHILRIWYQHWHPGLPHAVYVSSDLSNNRLSLCNDSGDSCLDGRRVCANNLLDALAVFEQNERRHSANAQLLCNVRNLVNVNLVEADLVVLLGVPKTKNC